MGLVDSKMQDLEPVSFWRPEEPEIELTGVIGNTNTWKKRNDRLKSHM